MLSNPGLWHRISQYDFEHLVHPSLLDGVLEAFGQHPNPSTQALAAKLVRKRQWKHHAALRAIEEYKRFAYLAVVSPTLVTPSRIVDAVWHEHLLFTQPYASFCSEVIEYPLHHVPELLHNADTPSYIKQYKHTLDLYKHEFGAAPPADIWGHPKFTWEEDDQPALVLSYAGSGSEAGGLSGGAPGGVQSEEGAGFGGFEDGNGGGGGASGDWGSDGGGSDSGSSGDSGGSSCSSSCGSSCGGGD